jgi:hypothetical protein
VKTILFGKVSQNDGERRKSDIDKNLRRIFEHLDLPGNTTIPMVKM